MELLIDGNRGIYIPQLFFEWYGHQVLNADDLSEELNEISNPNNEDYWDAWEDVLDKAEIEIKGVKGQIYQDQDLWFVPDGEILPNED